VSDKVKEKHQTLPDVVSINLAAVMKDVVNMKYMERAFDQYLATLSPDERIEQKAAMKQELINGRLVLESLLQRLLTSIG
jgi:hypothetical protein